jgi:hypothetical protein
MKYSQWIGVAAAIALIISGFVNWTWYPDIHKYFTGYFSENNIYGKPGKIFSFLSAIAIVFYLIPKVWAKRWNLLVCSIVLAYSIKTFILFSACYRGVCPVRQPGLWLMLVSACIMMLCALLPDLSINNKEATNKLSGK